MTHWRSGTSALMASCLICRCSSFVMGTWRLTLSLMPLTVQQIGVLCQVVLLKGNSMDDPTLFDQEPVARARATDPDTSHQAALSVSNLPDRQKWVLWLLQDHGPMTDLELLTKYRDRRWEQSPTQSESGLRTRRKELVDLGLVRDSGHRRKLPSGRNAIVWEVVK